MGRAVVPRPLCFGLRAKAVQQRGGKTQPSATARNTSSLTHELLKSDVRRHKAVFATGRSGNSICHFGPEEISGRARHVAIHLVRCKTALPNSTTRTLSSATLYSRARKGLRPTEHRVERPKHLQWQKQPAALRRRHLEAVFDIKQILKDVRLRH